MSGPVVSTQLWIPVLVLVVLGLVAVPGAISAEASDAGGFEPAAGDTPAMGVSAITAQVDNESTERHRNPAAYDEGGDQDELAAWFEQRLVDRLGDSSVELSEGQYDLASEHLGDSFGEQFEDYVDVAGDTGREETADQIDEAHDQQTNLTESRRSYDETYESYEEAKAAGDETRARELARELERLANRMNTSSTSLQGHYEAIEGDVGTNLSEQRAAVESVNQEVQETQSALRQAEFTETELSVSRVNEADPISFVDPLQAKGTLSTVDGDPITNETVQLTVENQHLTVETGSDGSFSATYRPISIPASTESISVAYVPRSASGYLGSTVSVSATVEPVMPTIEVPAISADSVSFADEVSVETAATVNGDPVDELPLAIHLGDQRLDVVETASNGSASASVRIPSTIPAGERELTVELPFTDRALEPASASTAVTVTESPSSLSVETSHTPTNEVVVDGMYTADSTPVPNASITVAVSDGSTTAVTTGSDGRFETTVALPDSATEVTVSAGGEGSNLEPAEATVTIGAGTEAGREPFPVPVWLVALAGVFLAAPLAGWWWLRRRDRSDANPDGSMAVDSEISPAERPSVATKTASETLLSSASSALGDGRQDEAVRAAYVAVRRLIDDADDRTHWEFYRSYADGQAVAGDSAERDSGVDTGSDDAAISPAALRSLTAAYERAAFGPESVDHSVAERVLSRAHALYGTDESDSI